MPPLRNSLQTLEEKVDLIRDRLKLSKVSDSIFRTNCNVDRKKWLFGRAELRSSQTSWPFPKQKCKSCFNYFYGITKRFEKF